MSRSSLTAVFVERVRKRGKYYDTLGLYLRVDPTGRRYWEQRVTVRGRRRTLGIGRYPIVTLKVAREAALENLRVVQAGDDPILLRRAVQRVPTLTEAARAVLELHRSKWSSCRHANLWMASLEQHVLPRLGGVPVSDLTSSDLLSVLTPIWSSIPDTASRVRQRVSLVMRWAIAQGFRTDDPAGDALTTVLPSLTLTKAHYRALHHSQVSAALDTVRSSDAYPSTKLLFEFLVLTAARSGEARFSQWAEIDLGLSTWTVPAERMKARREHQVPLSTRVLAVLDEARERFSGDGLVFPSKTGRPPSDATVSKLIRELGIRAVPHGFRSSFRDWCGESGVAREVAEACLAHVVSNKTEAAYARSDLFNRRVPVMQDWANYVAFGSQP